MKQKDGRNEMKEFLVMVSMGLPGLGCLVGGFGVLKAAGVYSIPGAVLIAIGCTLILCTGYYHYRKDYAGGAGKRGLARFILITVFSALAGVIATGTLLRLLRN